MTALIILDGFGLRNPSDDNAISVAGTPYIDNLAAQYPTTQLCAGGMAVGLPEGQMGNSEVGHTNIGAGRVVYQELTRISKAITDGTFQDSAALQNMIAHLKTTNGALHCMGLISDGGVHSHTDHLLALVDMAKANGIKKVYIHAFLDGRDVPPASGAGFLREMQTELKKRKCGQIATVMGRYYAMDRDSRWERVKQAWDAMIHGLGQPAADPAEAVEESHKEEVFDEFVKPVILTGASPIKDGDAVICFNFRPDRAREITRAFTDPGFEGFEREKIPDVFYVCMTQYDETLKNCQIAFPPEGRLQNTLGEWLFKQCKTQLRIAETEKYAHVTFFFNGGEEKPYPGEFRVLVPSPKVATYDLQPQMSAYAVTAEALRIINEDKYDVMVCNFANADMVGHTGVLQAAVDAIRTVDACVGKLTEAIINNGGQCIVTADHGNAERMWDAENNAPYTAHTTDSPVPCIVVSEKFKGATLREGGILADIAPTLLEMMGLEKPGEMTGESLIV
ncbi:MAG: 2,3-bisphosphoglycerate-independent phosphoglycerate mutase [Clostridia bacterium]|nr:2,3-bisphosphoglycerate-independent phosphoglycerate mutase [Clostridia bacterium]